MGPNLRNRLTDRRTDGRTDVKQHTKHNFCIIPTLSPSSPGSPATPGGPMNPLKEINRRNKLRSDSFPNTQSHSLHILMSTELKAKYNLTENNDFLQKGYSFINNQLSGHRD